MPRFETRKLALTAALAAIYAIFRLIPLSKLIGISGTITASGIVIPIIAILIEPELGVLAVLIGTMVASLSPLNPLKFAGLDFLPGTMNLLVASFAVRGQRLKACAALLVAIALFALTPNIKIFVGSNLYSPPLPFFWLHIAALGVLASPISKKIVDWLRSRDYTRVAASIGIVSFAGTMTEHVTGGILYALFFGPGAQRAWPAIFLAYPIERTAIVAGGVLVCAPFIIASRVLPVTMLGRTDALSRDYVRTENS